MNIKEPIKILDHGFVRFIEASGHGDAGHHIEQHPGIGLPTYESSDYECGIIEAARQSTQASFRGWEDAECQRCSEVEHNYPQPMQAAVFASCPECGGKGYLPGDQRLLASLFNNKPQHATPFEFSDATIEVQAPIFVFREWHRHRTQSYNEMSARYAPLPNLNYVPDWENMKQRGEAAEKSRNRQEKGTAPWNEAMAKAWLDRLPGVYEYLEKVYQDALQAGIPKEMARIELPVGRYTRMRAKANLRNWLAFMTLRHDPGAMWEIRQYAEAMATILAAVFPRTWKLFVDARTNAPKPLAAYSEEEFRAEAIRRGLLMKPFPDVQASPKT